MQKTQSIDLLPTATLAASCTAAVLWYIYHSKQKRNAASSSKEPYPPSPPGRSWLLGHTLNLYHPQKAPDVLVLEWMKRLNSKVICFDLPIFFPVPRIIAVADEQLVEYIIKNNFPKSPTYRELIPVIGRKSMIITEGKEWAALRRRYNPGFSPDFLKNVVTVILDKCQRMVEACHNNIAASRITNMNKLTIDMTSDVIAQVAFGEDWGSHNPTLERMRILLDEMGKTQTNKLRSFNPLVRFKVRRLQQQLDADMQELVRRRLVEVHETVAEKDDSQQRPPKKERDVLSLSLIAAIGTTPPKEFSLSNDDMEEIVSQLKSFYFAGHDTTATVIAWAIWLLAQHPDKLARVRKELLVELGEWAEEKTNSHNTPAFADWQRCTYLEAVFTEVLRLYPPASTARFVADPDATFNGYKIGDSILWLSAYSCHRHPDHWKEPDVFQPERFLDWNEAEGSNKYHFMPFSRGSRDCIGKYFAMLEGKIAIAMLVLKFDVTKVVHTDEIMAARVTNVPLNGCQVQLAVRD